MKKNAEVAAEKEYKAILDKARAEAEGLFSKGAEKEAAATREGKKDKTAGCREESKRDPFRGEEKGR